MILPPNPPAFTTTDAAKFFDVSPATVKTGVLAALLEHAPQYDMIGKGMCFTPESVRRAWLAAKSMNAEMSVGLRTSVWPDKRWVPWTFGHERIALYSTNMANRMEPHEPLYWDISEPGGLEAASIAVQRSVPEVVWAIQRGEMTTHLAFDSYDGPAKLFLLPVHRKTAPRRAERKIQVKRERKATPSQVPVGWKPQAGDRFMPLSEVASVLEVTVPGVYRYVYDGRLKTYDVPGEHGVRVLRSDVVKFIRDAKRCDAGDVKSFFGGKRKTKHSFNWAPKAVF